jgi:hypothetical protein
VAADISEEMRRLVADRANRQCEYSFINEADSGFHHQVDHVVSRKHGGMSTLENLVWLVCSAIDTRALTSHSIDSETGSVTRLLNPRQDRWSDHFRIENGWIIPTSPVGRATASLSKFNTAERIAERLQLLALGRYSASQ